MSRKILVIGLDAAPPHLVFEKFRKQLPNITHLAQNGLYGPLRSTHPPITIPAWIVMMTSRNPGTLGIYGFRHRKKNTYNEIYIVNSRSIKERAVWDYLSENNKRSIIISVPPGYPPRIIRGYWISCFITPSNSKKYTFPLSLREEIESHFGPYIFDADFRIENREKVRQDVFRMTKQHFDVVEYLIQQKKWDFFMFVEIGVDRIQHAFWKFFDKEHHLYEPGNEFEHVIPEYYEYIDRRIGELLEKIGEDTYVLIVSDHGAKRMKGAFVINEWLAEQGYLEFEREPREVVNLDRAEINWDKTIAWGWGGYYARVFINLEGREPNGIVKREDYEDVRQQLIEDIRKIRGPNGEPMKNLAYRPEDLYPITKGDPPDLIVYFDDLYWRSAGTVGHNKLYLPENDIGPDDAVHDWDGIFILYDPQETLNRERRNAEIKDIAPTILNLLGLPIPENMEGRSLVSGDDIHG